MTLGFSIYWPGKGRELTFFSAKILSPYNPAMQKAFGLPKIHTFRIGHRWRAGVSIQMVTGNRTPRRYQFNRDIPALQTCISVQEALFCCRQTGGVEIAIGEQGAGQRWLTQEELLLFAVNDGFNSLEELTRWFFPKGYIPIDPPLSGQIIHWTDFQYKLPIEMQAPPMGDPRWKLVGSDWVLKG